MSNESIPLSEVDEELTEEQLKELSKLEGDIKKGDYSKLKKFNPDKYMK